MAWSSVSRVVLLGLGLLALSTVQANACEVPAVGDLEPVVHEYFRCIQVMPIVAQGARQGQGRLALYKGPGVQITVHQGRVWDTVVVSGLPTPPRVVRELSGLVCSRGTIQELPVERQSRWIDGATVGKPGYRCLDFK